MAAVFSVQATTLVTALGSMQLIMMLFTYVSCVHQGHCQVWLPMISDTWTHPPASYVSRWVVSIVALGMSLAQILFWKAEDARLCCSSSAWQAIAVFSCFCLAVVGAVCESTIPTCRGNDALHSTSAVVFFALYNSSMAVFTANGRRRDRTGIALMLLSLCCKVRWFMPAPTAIGVGEPVPVVAIIEWADVILIIVWTAWLVFKRKAITTRTRAPSEPRGAPTSIVTRRSPQSQTRALAKHCAHRRITPSDRAEYLRSRPRDLARSTRCRGARAREGLERRTHGGAAMERLSLVNRLICAAALRGHAGLLPLLHLCRRTCGATLMANDLRHVGLPPR